MKTIDVDALRSDLTELRDKLAKVDERIGSLQFERGILDGDLLRLQELLDFAEKYGIKIKEDQ